jgi:hypothetical protein
MLVYGRSFEVIDRDDKTLSLQPGELRVNHGHRNNDEPLAANFHSRNAGELLIGQYTPFYTGNYCVRTNAYLPTGCFARTISRTTIFDFLKRKAYLK